MNHQAPQTDNKAILEAGNLQNMTEEGFVDVDLDDPGLKVEYLVSITEAPNFKQGLAQYDVGSGPALLRSNQGIKALKHIVQNTNPIKNKVKGFFKHLKDFLFGGGPIKRNCVHCSKAVDLNLRSLTLNSEDRFWYANSISPSSLTTDVNSNNYHQESIPYSGDDGIPLIQCLDQKCVAGKRYIIIVPQLGYQGAHAMNLLKTKNGEFYVLDGQVGKIYNLKEKDDQRTFNKKYGASENSTTLRLYLTGDAPEIANSR